jgi:hypothetical protein
MVLKETGYESMDWIHTAQDVYWWGDFVNSVRKFWVPLNGG